ncbi:MAG: flagellar basal body L-ring protein FlgH [bacterium]
MNVQTLMRRLVILFVCLNFLELPAQDFGKYKSLYTDIKANVVGDIVTIVIIESASGSRQSNVNSSSKSSLDASGTLTGNLTQFLPLIGASSELGSQHNGNEGTAQKDVLTGKITAVITEITPNGNLVLQGMRHLEVNGETHILKVKGVARPKDVTSQNTVLSYNLANVQIAYKKAGLMNKIGKPGWLNRWTNLLMVVGLGAAAYLGIGAATN